MLCGLSTTALAYGLTSFGVAIIHNIFLLFHVDTFLTIYGLDLRLFYAVEIVFATWNSVNDAALGWWMDVAAGGVRRTDIILFGSPALGLSFLAFWFDLGGESQIGKAAHLLIALCLYDTVFTMIVLAHSALLADIAPHLRTQCNMMTAVFSILGSFSTFYGYKFWSASGITSEFRVFSVAIVVLATCALLATVAGFKESGRVKLKDALADSWVFGGGSNKRVTLDDGPAAIQLPGLTVRKLAGELFSSRNFMLFSGLNLIQIFNCSFNNTFFRTLLDHTLVDSTSSSFRAGIVAASYIIPHLNTVLATPVINKLGLYAVVMGLILIKVGTASATWMLSSTVPALLWMFLVFNRYFTEAMCRVMNLILADVVDEDRAVFRRPHKMSAVIFGANALLTKPGQSLAPVFGWSLLKGAGYVEGEDSPAVDRTMWFMIVLLPLLTAAAQFVLWYAYSPSVLFNSIMGREHGSMKKKGPAEAAAL